MKQDLNRDISRAPYPFWIIPLMALDQIDLLIIFRRPFTRHSASMMTYNVSADRPTATTPVRPGKGIAADVRITCELGWFKITFLIHTVF